MTIKAWHIEHEWQEPFVEALRRRGATPETIGQVLGRVDTSLARSGRSAQEHFGDPSAYAAGVDLTGAVDGRVSRIRALLLVVAGLIGMFLALWGFTGLARDGVDTVAGMPPVLPLVVGLVVTVAAAVADTALGRHADVLHDTSGGAQPGLLALVLNRLAPWIILALTLVGMLLIWVKEQ